MNLNYAIQHEGQVAWTGAAAKPIDLRRHIGFSFTFHVNAALAADTVFEFESAPASDADICVPGTWSPVIEVLTCVGGIGNSSTDHASITIPANTPVGSICKGTLPCKPDAFLRVKALSGDTADVDIVATLSGPR